MVLRVSIQAGTDRGATNPQPAQALCRALYASGIPFNRFGVGAKFLAETDRHGILQMGATGFNHIVKFDSFGLQGNTQIFQYSQ